VDKGCEKRQEATLPDGAIDPTSTQIDEEFFNDRTDASEATSMPGIWGSGPRHAAVERQ
jgi:hypothetical protein